MDLRTIMNNEGGGASNRPPVSQASSSPIDPPPPKRVQTFTEYPSRPPPPQHPSHASPDRTASFSGPVPSPHQQFNAGPPPPLNTAIPPQHSQSPSLVSTPYGPGACDPYSASGYSAHPQHPAGPLASPYTPQQPTSAGPQAPEQQSYFAQQRSHSLHSVMTNPLAPGETFPNKEGPPSAPQPPPSQHQFSPSAHRSVPGTPLGPPPTFASRQSPSSARPQSSGRESPHNPLSSPRPMQTQDTLMRDFPQTHSPSNQRYFSPGSRPTDSTTQLHPAVKQESIELTTPHSSSRQDSAAAADLTGAAPLRSSEDRKLNESPTTPFAPGTGSEAHVSPVATAHSQMNSSPSGQRGGSHHLKMEVDSEPTARVNSQQPRIKRRRYNEPPIYAQRSRTRGKCPVIPNPQPLVPKHARQSLQDSWAIRRHSSTVVPAPPSATSSRTTRTPGAAPSVPAAATSSSNGPPSQPAATNPSEQGSLGIWEPSITGFIPHEEITNELCNFLFRHVVARNDVGAGPAGAAASGQGAIIEVEAKLGHIIDQDRRERLNLPIKTEAVINREMAGFRTSFESNMTVEQHRAYNNFLNETVKASMTPPRVALSYAHKKERDTFYEVSPDELPPVIRSNLNPRHKPKVRVTTDQRTGEVLAKIVKCRIADMDVYSPRTPFDWRVSVNLEMEYPGDISSLSPVDMRQGGRGERNKDRMSYRHLAYQVDLTQVARAEVSLPSRPRIVCKFRIPSKHPLPSAPRLPFQPRTSIVPYPWGPFSSTPWKHPSDSALQPPTKNDFDHELEIEISGAELKRQGQLAAAGDPKNQYEELVKGFVDNVRVLARVKS
ncbi:hypothetical protein N7532_009297 [Penicillium argentinense]|uniref:mRNA-capping enzyme subunit beta n=1 Tax=Penicillium argentinense TaxID=1131581 RepID=A0A9W9K2G2_9EURO|nr:uncharacterized protein N7532_009297 [Penicillium argentinense]KAJ5090613.1 hypothetical protein N7532_009297 [Penicillium argentinense]